MFMWHRCNELEFTAALLSLRSFDPCLNINLYFYIWCTHGWGNDLIFFAFLGNNSTYFLNGKLLLETEFLEKLKE